LPIPDQKIFPKGTGTHAVVITSRGCPYQCTYCFNHSYRKLFKTDGDVIRRRSVDHVMKELLILKDAGYKFIQFMDDVFILSAEWIEEFSVKYREQISIPFSCLVRANYVKSKTIGLLKKAGCFRIMMGIEAGNKQVRNKILKRNMKEESILEATSVIKKEGLNLVTANIVAIPGGTLENDLETLDLNIKCKPDYASVAILQPYPKTEIFVFAEALGMIDTKGLKAVESSFGFGFESNLKWKDVKEKKQIENLHKLFPLTVRFPFLRPLVKHLIKLPPNRIFRMIYLSSVNWGIYCKQMPPSVGLPILIRKLKRRFIG
jgi:radical SAM superfamily enzyme YgiQ (UPF0313 family)